MKTPFQRDNAAPEDDLFLDYDIRPSSIESWFPAPPEDFYLFNTSTFSSDFWKDLHDVRVMVGEDEEQSLANSSSRCFSTSNQSEANQLLPSIASLQKKKVQEEAPRTEKKFFCNCSKSKCIKGYCQCLQGGEVCSPETCGCTECHNILETEVHHEKLRVGETVGRKGCTCKRSQCRKRYCDCLRDGNKCGPECECVGCQNKSEQMIKKEDRHDRKLRSKKSAKN